MTTPLFQPSLVCEHCGAVSENEYLHRISHYKMWRGGCIAQYLITNHVRVAIERGEGIEEEITRAKQHRLTEKDWQ